MTFVSNLYKVSTFYDLTRPNCLVNALSEIISQYDAYELWKRRSHRARRFYSYSFNVNVAVSMTCSGILPMK
ncbi:hypothetical protein TMatcc_000868 [Talaromyces marneffei ATCC 18224]|uniref:uncharacterized protein n=1 Tax=Talaromyces marneffei TaxID=37727 RepID=UPI0012A9E4A7|nr:uncharacterized protein EYB26_003412 [Talaromyces marneffei]QGA15752.1 hypothetical protein EYB26_003412 [Talaromyces marneffei]